MSNVHFCLTVNGNNATHQDEFNPLTFGNIESVDNCHPECNGCSEASSAVSCFSCKHYTQALRNRAGFKCVSKCEDGFYADGDKCKKCTSNCVTCSQAERCLTCHGALLLIETPTQRIDQGHCVNSCPLGLHPDYSHATQARCLIKTSWCEDGYYESLAGKCQACDEACKTCHGPSPLECLECASGYGNNSALGYCRPCCTVTNTLGSVQNHCNNCAKLPKTSIPERPIKFRHLLFIIIFILLVGLVCYHFCIKRFLFSVFTANDLEYTPLKMDEDRAEEPDFENKQFNVNIQLSNL